MNGLRALSVRQPWAWLLAHGYKDVENRAWPTALRGPILLHAGQSVDKEGDAWLRQRLGPAVPLPPLASLPRGGIVGRAHLVDCVRASPSPWFFGPFGFVLADAAPLPFQPMRGMLGFFRVNDVAQAQAWASPRQEYP
ncbi:MAG: ASCH domain-containing protein [Gemmatimonadaceae bacterium]|nr:ASCH domain-containing protein [Gemmatimonadaceae bacterium]